MSLPTTAVKEFKPAKQRKYQTLLLNGFKGNTGNQLIDLLIHEVFPEQANTPCITICADLWKKELPVKDMIRIFNDRDVVLIIKTPRATNSDTAYPMLNLCKTITNYLLRDPDSLNIPLIVLDFATVPEGCKFMCDTVISHHSDSLYNAGKHQVEISRQCGGSSGRLIDVSSLNLN